MVPGPAAQAVHMLAAAGMPWGRGLTEVIWLTLVNAWGPPGCKRRREDGPGFSTGREHVPAQDVVLYEVLVASALSSPCLSQHLGS